MNRLSTGIQESQSRANFATFQRILDFITRNGHYQIGYYPQGHLGLFAAFDDIPNDQWLMYPNMSVEDWNSCIDSTHNDSLQKYKIDSSVYSC